jgi:hypothetical protein
MWVPTSATECASVASVLRPWPVENTRARAESLGGTSTTSWPSASRRIATCRPIPLHPSTAQTRFGHRPTYCIIAANPEVSVAKRPLPRTSSPAVITSIVTDRLWGSIPITTRSLLVICCSFGPFQ